MSHSHQSILYSPAHSVYFICTKLELNAHRNVVTISELINRNFPGGPKGSSAVYHCARLNPCVCGTDHRDVFIT